MPSGSTTINFGSFPGTSRAFTDVSGQTGLVSTTRIEAFVLPITTATKTDDEHRSSEINVIGYYKVDGTLTIEGYNSSPESIVDNSGKRNPHFLYGEFTVGWAWSNT